MRTKVSDLYHSGSEKYSLVLHSGESGLSNSVSWIYLAEDIQNISFLKGGELVITTGLFTQSGTCLFDFIRSLVTYNCSGLLINVGKYLETADLSPEILDFCKISKFPLITMPWKVHLVDIMQDYCKTLLHDTQNADHLNAAFQSALYQDPIHDTTLMTLNQNGFPTAADYRIIVIQNLRNVTRITFTLNRLSLKYHLFEHDNLQILLYLTCQSTPSLSEIMDILMYYDGIALGIGNEFHSLSKIGICYKRARFALAASLFWSIPSVNFDELGIFQILFSSCDPELLQSMCQNSLGVLEDFDSAHDTDYMDTLKVFLLSDCNLLKTAGKLHTHRNTVIYRMKKIKELLGTELDDSKIKFDLLMAFYIREYFDI